MNWITEHLPAWNSWIAVLLYWLPAALCAYGYLVRSVKLYRRDLAERAAVESDATGRTHYYPRETFGSLIGRAVMTVLPVGNLFAAIFNVAPEVFGDLFAWIGRVFDQPLVPKRNRSPTQ